MITLFGAYQICSSLPPKSLQELGKNIFEYHIKKYSQKVPQSEEKILKNANTVHMCYGIHFTVFLEFSKNTENRVCNDIDSFSRE